MPRCLGVTQSADGFSVDLDVRDRRDKEIVQPCLLLLAHPPYGNLLQWPKALAEYLKRVLVECLSFKPQHTKA